MKDGQDMWKQMPTRTRVIVAASGGAILLIAAGLSWWAMAPSYAVLFKDMNPDDATEVTADLGRWNIPYRLDADGRSLLVPEDAVLDTRMRLASEGLPNHGTVGFELFNQADYGMTDFTQQVDYQRALQGELERTITSLSEIRYARVHLTLKQKGLFLQDEDHPKASITLALKPGRRLEAAQITGIQRLTAAAVDGLDAKDVVVLDDTGAPLSAPDLGGAAATDVGARFDEKQRVETALRGKIEALLKDVFGLSRYSLSVDVTLNFDKEKDVNQQVVPQGQDGNGLVNMKKETHSESPAGTGASSAHGSNVASEVEYAHSTSLKEVEYAPGRVQRVSVGILVPDSLNASELQHLHDVVAAAVGLDPQRGDQIQLSTWDFARQPSIGAAAGAQHGPAGTNAAAESTSVPQAARWNTSVLLAIAAAAAAALLLALSLVGRRRPARLTAVEREAALREIRGWLGQTEGARHD